MAQVSDFQPPEVSDIWAPLTDGRCPICFVAQIQRPPESIVIADFDPRILAWSSERRRLRALRPELDELLTHPIGIAEDLETTRS
jgi:hypothetical protein